MNVSRTEKLILKEIADSVKRIESNLVGDEIAGVEGIYSKVKRHDSYIEADKKLKWTISGIASVVTIIFSEAYHKIFG